jgi:hypothetical protein
MSSIVCNLNINIFWALAACHVYFLEAGVTVLYATSPRLRYASPDSYREGYSGSGLFATITSAAIRLEIALIIFSAFQQLLVISR